MTIHGQSGFLRFYVLLGVDAFLAILSGITGHFLRFGPCALPDLYSDHSKAILIVTVVLISSSYLFDVYNLSTHRDKRIVATNIMQAALVSFLALSIIYYLFPSQEMGRGLLAITLFVFIGYQFFWHISFAALFSGLLPSTSILVLGTGELAAKIGALVQSEKFQYSHSFVGYVATPNRETHHVSDHMILCGIADLMRHINAHAVTHIVVAEQERRGNSPMLLELLNCKLRGIMIQDSPTFYEMQTGKLLLEHMDMDWLIFSHGFRRSTVFTALKRLMDIFLSLIGLIILVPFFPLIATLVKLNAPGPIIYKQKRVGQWGKVFSLYKFRTMEITCEEKSGAVWAMRDDPRIRPIGGFLRKCRIDELPQLYNVLKGQMSFVGPRPERPEFVKDLETVIPLYGKRHFIKPGLTGWAQVCYPYGASVEDSYEKLRFDLYYFKNMTPIFDAIIFLKTIKVVLCGSGGR